METLTTGAGLGALGFWVFVAAAVATTMWDKIRKRDAQHETLRRVIESGQTLDDELTDKLLMLTSGSGDLDRDMWVSGIILLVIAPALALFGWLLSLVVAPILLPILASVGAFLFALGLGFLLVSHLIARRQKNTEVQGFG